jgi:hypothetical protein
MALDDSRGATLIGAATDLLTDFSDVVRKELRLAHAEMSQKLSQRIRASRLDGRGSHSRTFGHPSTRAGSGICARKRRVGAALVVSSRRGRLRGAGGDSFLRRPGQRPTAKACFFRRRWTV